MRRFSAIGVAGIAAAALAGSAIAATPRSHVATHVMDVALPHGSTAHIEYAGNIAPRVTIAPAEVADADGDWTEMPPPSFARFDRMIEEMNRRTAQILSQARHAEHQSATGARPYIASYGNMPSGVTSYSVTSVSNGSGTCTRTTEMVSQGAGKAPKVTSNVSGDCGQAGPSPSSAPVDRT